MTDKQIMIDGADVSGCIYYQHNMCTATKDNYGDCSFYCKDYEMKDCYYKQLKRKDEENEELTADTVYLRDRVGKLEQAILRRNKQLDNLKAENEELKRNITEIFACLIKANRSGIITDTIWVGTITTLWDYIAQTLGIEGDQIQIEKQILQKAREVEG